MSDKPKEPYVTITFRYRKKPRHWLPNPIIHPMAYNKHVAFQLAASTVIQRMPEGNLLGFKLECKPASPDDPSFVFCYFSMTGIEVFSLWDLKKLEYFASDECPGPFQRLAFADRLAATPKVDHVFMIDRSSFAPLHEGDHVINPATRKIYWPVTEMTQRGFLDFWTSAPSLPQAKL